MKSSTRFIALSCFVIMALALSACGGNATPTKSPTTAASTATTAATPAATSAATVATEAATTASTEAATMAATTAATSAAASTEVATVAASEAATTAATTAATMAPTMAASMAASMEASAAATSGAAGATSNLKIGVVTDSGQVDDRSFNQSAWEGAQDAAKDLGAVADYLLSNGPEDYAANIQTFVDKGYNVVVTVGFLLGPATAEAAAKYPNVQFIGVDVEPSKDKPLPNLSGVIFHEDQSGFLAGVLAARMTKSNIVAAVLGTDVVPAVVRFKEGFDNGVKYASEGKVKVISTYHAAGNDAFSDPAWGATTAAQAMDQGADVVFGAGGKTGNGALQEAAKRTTKDKPVYCIGVDTDQWLTLPEAHPCLISSATKLIRAGVSDLIKMAAKGELKGGAYYGEVALAPFHDFDTVIPSSVAKELEQIALDLKSGKIQSMPAAATEAATASASDSASATEASTTAATTASATEAATMAPTMAATK